jgi:hypothetical protein
MEKSDINSKGMNSPSPKVSSSAFRGRRLALISGLLSLVAIAWIVIMQDTLTHQPKRGEDNKCNASKIVVLRGKSGEERDSSSEHMLASDEEAALLGKGAPLLPFKSGSAAAPICHLDPSPDAPVPVILLSLGRSGSGSTWDAMGTLTGEATQSEEYTGGGSGKSENSS